MLCEKCGKNQATTHIKTVVNGVAREYNLCSFCAAEHGYASSGLSGFISSMLGSSQYINKSTVKCSVCGSCFADISKTGKVGCSSCYTTFYNELLPYIKRIHGSDKHVGSRPDFTQKEFESIESLKAELRLLISEEKYEQAAVVRDKIKKMEETGNE